MSPSQPMYSTAWFHTFAARIPEAATQAEVEAIARWAPPAAFPRLLDVGCGVGRVSAPLVARGYRVTGIDTSAAALREARSAAPGARLVALDQRYLGDMAWTFDVAIILWNSLGFGSRAEDRDLLTGMRRILRPGGKLLLDLYNPEWLAAHEQHGQETGEGAIVHRWLRDGRSFHEIRYADGSVDHIQFNVYGPDEIRPMLMAAGLSPDLELVWWDEACALTPESARYQLICTRMEDGWRPGIESGS